MQVQEIDINKIHPYKNNPRINDKSISSVAKSIEQFGFQQPIVVDKDNVVIVGHTRLKAAKKLGLSHVPVIVASNLDEAHAKAYRLADNKVGDDSVWDNKKLLEELDSLDKIDDQLYTGFDTSEKFQEVLDEDDNLPITENTDGVTYSVSFKTQNEKTMEKVKEFIESVADLES